MAKGFIARYNGTCARCGKAIVRHSHFITWSRTERGKAYHLDCERPTVAPIEEPMVTYAPAPVTPTVAPMVAKPAIDVAEITRLVASALGVQAQAPSLAPSTAVPELAQLTLETPWWDILKVLRASGLVSRILIIGPPGTGKSTASASIGTVRRVTMSPDMSSSDLKGTWTLQGKETVYLDGAATLALRQGATLVLDEIDMSSAEATSVLFALLDHPAHITLPTNEQVTAQPGYTVIGTSNNTHEALLPAIADRFEIIIDAHAPVPDVLGTLDNATRTLCERYYLSLAKLTWRRSPTARRSLTFTALTRAGVPQRVAARLVFGDASDEVLSALATATETKVTL